MRYAAIANETNPKATNPNVTNPKIERHKLNKINNKMGRPTSMYHRVRDDDSRRQRNRKCMERTTATSAFRPPSLSLSFVSIVPSPQTILVVVILYFFVCFGAPIYGPSCEHDVDSADIVGYTASTVLSKHPGGWNNPLFVHRYVWIARARASRACPGPARPPTHTSTHLLRPFHHTESVVCSVLTCFWG